jgi:predicted Zn-dependent protease
VLAHEISHVTQRHIARMLGQQDQMQLPMLAALAAALLLGRSRPDLATGALVGAQAGAVQTQLGYSRDFEREADRLGFRALESAGFDPHAMASFFEKMQRATRISDDSKVPGYFRTHPLTFERIADIQNRLERLPYRQVADSLDFQLVRAKLKADGGETDEALRFFQSTVRDQRYAVESAARYGLAEAEEVTELRASVAAAARLARIDQQVARIMQEWDL